MKPAFPADGIDRTALIVVIRDGKNVGKAVTEWVEVLAKRFIEPVVGF
jgi:hypothetical protein